jgi:hypothetical protein
MLLPERVQRRMVEIDVQSPEHREQWLATLATLDMVSWTGRDMPKPSWTDLRARSGTRLAVNPPRMLAHHIPQGGWLEVPVTLDR